jgi:hypothetical protein
MTEQTRTEIEAAAFRSLLAHLQRRTDVQNIDLMNLAGFCRNCLAKWVAEAANARGVPMTDADAREVFYGMPYPEWKGRHQTAATAEQMRLFKETQGLHAFGAEGDVTSSSRDG